MIRFIGLFFIFFISQSAQATWTLVQHKSSGCTTNPCTMTPASTTTAGNLGVICYSQVSGSISISTITGFTVPASIASNNSAGNGGISCAYNLSLGASASFSINTSGTSGSGNAYFSEYSTTRKPVLFEKAGTATNNGSAFSTAPASVAVTPLSWANDVVVSSLMAGTPSACPATGSWTGDFTSNGGLCSSINTASGASSNWTTASSHNAIVGFAFRESFPSASINNPIYY